MATAPWLAHGDDRVVDSLHDILEGPQSMAPVAMEPTKPPPTRRGFGAILPAGIFLGVVVALGMRMVVPAADASVASAIAGRLSESAFELAAALPSDDGKDRSGAARVDQEAEAAKKVAAVKRKRSVRRAHSAPVDLDPAEDDIYAAFDSVE